jgi:beta-1,4-mannosyltransferase
MTSKFITMSDCDVDPRYTPSVRIPHPDYRPLTRDCDELEKPKEPGLIIYFGLIRPYKNVEHLAEVFSQLESQDLNLEITGFTESKCLIESIETTAEKDSRVTFRNVFLSDRELYSEISRATLVVLPYTRLLNSGAALLALSLRRPVLVPETCAMRELANEVGRDWVQMYAGTLTAAHLEAAVDSVADLDPNDAPNLTARTWTACAAATYRVYCGA